jgi:hypothetical protein
MNPMREAPLCSFVSFVVKFFQSAPKWICKIDTAQTPWCLK